MLYFANSLGAAGGVLFAGFWLVAFAGLPGTLLIAAMINVLVAAIVIVALKSRNEVEPEADCGRGGERSRDVWTDAAQAVAIAARGELRNGALELRLRDRLDSHALARARQRHALVRVDALGVHPRALAGRVLGASARRFERRLAALRSATCSSRWVRWRSRRFRCISRRSIGWPI